MHTREVDIDLMLGCFSLLNLDTIQSDLVTSVGVSGGADAW